MKDNIGEVDCTIRVWLHSLGYTLVLSGMLVRAFRLHKIIQKGKEAAPKDGTLCLIIIMIVLSQLAILIPMRLEGYSCELEEESAGQFTWAYIAMGLYGGVLLIITLAMVYKARPASRKYSEDSTFTETMGTMFFAVIMQLVLTLNADADGNQVGLGRAFSLALLWFFLACAGEAKLLVEIYEHHYPKTQTSPSTSLKAQAKKVINILRISPKGEGKINQSPARWGSVVSPIQTPIQSPRGLRTPQTSPLRGNAASPSKSVVIHSPTSQIASVVSRLPSPTQSPIQSPKGLPQTSPSKGKKEAAASSSMSVVIHSPRSTSSVNINEVDDSSMPELEHPDTPGRNGASPSLSPPRKGKDIGSTASALRDLESLPTPLSPSFNSRIGSLVVTHSPSTLGTSRASTEPPGSSPSPKDNA